MKIRIMVILAAALLLFAACGKKEEAAETPETTEQKAAEETAAPEEEPEEPAEEPEEAAEDLEIPEESGYPDSEYEEEPDTTGIVDETVEEAGIEAFVDVPDYHGLELTKTVQTVTDQDVEDQLRYMLQAYPGETPEGQELLEGLVANVDFTAAIGGEPVDELSGDDFEFPIGENYYMIEGFDKPLVGHKEGDDVTFSLTVPDDFYIEEYAGQAVDYSVHVNAVKCYLEEPTDEWAAENTDYDTAAEFLANFKTDLQKEWDDGAENQLYNDAWYTVRDTAEFLQYPRDLYDKYYGMIEASLGKAAEAYEMDLDGFLDYNGIGREYLDQEARFYVQEELTALYVLSKEGKNAEDAEKEVGGMLWEMLGCESYDGALESGMERDSIDMSLKTLYAAKMIVENANVTEEEYDPSQDDFLVYGEDGEYYDEGSYEDYYEEDGEEAVG